MVGSIKDYTPNFNLIIPNFDIATWHDFLEDNFRAIDAMFHNLFDIQHWSGVWKNNTQYTKDQVLFIGNDNGSEYEGRLVKVLVDHTTAGNVTFYQYFTENPTHYELFADASTAQKFAELAREYMTSTEQYKNEAEMFMDMVSEDKDTVHEYAIQSENNAQIASNNAAITTTNAQQTAADREAITTMIEEFEHEYPGAGGNAVIILGFDGTLSGNTITFTPQDEYMPTVKNNYDYEIDLYFPAVGVLDDDVQIELIIDVANNTKATIRNVLSGSNNATFGDLKQMCSYDTDTGWRWVFNARYKSVDNNNYFIIPSTVVDLSEYSKKKESWSAFVTLDTSTYSGRTPINVTSALDIPHNLINTEDNIFITIPTEDAVGVYPFIDTNLWQYGLRFFATRSNKVPESEVKRIIYIQSRTGMFPTSVPVLISVVPSTVNKQEDLYYPSFFSPPISSPPWTITHDIDLTKSDSYTFSITDVNSSDTIIVSPSDVSIDNIKMWVSSGIYAVIDSNGYITFRYLNKQPTSVVTAHFLIMTDILKKGD